MTKARLAGAVVLVLGTAAALVVGGLLTSHPADDRPVALIVGISAIAAVLIAVGIGLLFYAGPPAGETPEGREPTSYRHTYALFTVVAVGIVVALTVRALLVPDTFGDTGYYRAAAVDDARNLDIHYQGSEVCEDCHDDIVWNHQRDAHAAVKCETCHGPGDMHVDEGGGSFIQVNTGKEYCLVCHQALAARPGAFPQISREEHYRFVGVDDESVDCVECHSPHQPLYTDRDLRQARLHPLIHRCRDCHAGRTNENMPRPDDHPAIFECNYCHESVVEDFTERSHAEVRCTACHIFRAESEFAGRIVRDSDPRFCLLCHLDADFRSLDAPPGVEWPEHREDMAEGPEDENKRCIDCHRNRIHGIQNGGRR